MIKVSCLIPTYNEEPRIGAVLEIVGGHELVDEVIVIDDGSKDATEKIVRDMIERFPKIRLIIHEKNMGKTAAICTGIREAKGEYLMLIDADLTRLTRANLTDLISPVLTGNVDITISLRGNTPWLWRKIGLDYISGERVMPRRFLIAHVEKLPLLPKFGLESYMNMFIIRGNMRIKIVKWPLVESPWKYKKVGLVKGIRGDMVMILDIFRTISIFGPVYQILKMKRLQVKNNMAKYPKVSVVIPAYNEEHVISPTLHAVLAEDYPNFEVIVIDNASTDRTGEVARAFPVKVILEPKKGLLSARERGRKEATGEIIVNIDADCLPEKDWLSRGVALFTHPSIVAVTGPYNYYDGGKFFSTVSLLLQKNAYYALNLFIQLPYIKQGAILIGGNNFIRADILEKAGGYNTSILFYGEDTNTAKRVSRHGKVIFSRDVVMKTSARRFKQEGTIRITLKYFYHFFNVLFSGKY